MTEDRERATMRAIDRLRENKAKTLNNNHNNTHEQAERSRTLSNNNFQIQFVFFWCEPDVNSNQCNTLRQKCRPSWGWASPPWLPGRAGLCWLEALAAPGRWWALLCCWASLQLAWLGSTRATTKSTTQKTCFNLQSIGTTHKIKDKLSTIYVCRLTCNMSLGSAWMSLTKARRRHL